MPNENDLYEHWRNAPAAERAEIEGQLFASVQRHARIVVWLRMEESNPELVHEIAKAAILGLGSFKGESQFSTWVHAIALEKVNQEMRRRSRYRRVFDDTVAIGEDDPDEGEHSLLGSQIEPDMLPGFRLSAAKRTCHPKSCDYSGVSMKAKSRKS